MSDPARHIPANPSGRSITALDLPDRLVARTVLVWAGLCLWMFLLTATGVWTHMAGDPPAPLHTPSGFLRLYNGAQLGGLVLLALLAVASPNRMRWVSRLSGPAIAVVTQALWLTSLPSPSPSGLSTASFPTSSLYVAAEAFKAIWLLAIGFGSGLMPERVSPGRAHRSSWTPVCRARPLAERAWPPFPGPSSS